MEFHPAEVGDRVPLEAYGDGGFRLGGGRIDGSIMLLPERADPWPVNDLSEVKLKDLAPVLSLGNAIEFVLIGTGEDMTRPPAEVMKAFAELNIGVEFMATGAACRTYNLLISEGREIAAVLIAVD